MTKGPVRRAQVIAPFGVGAILTVPGGTSLMCAGLDHWFDREPDSGLGEIEEEAFVRHEWRLEKALDVDSFRLPPDYRKHRWSSEEGANPNAYVKLPALRFPSWYNCTRGKCGLLKKYPRTIQQRRVQCPECGEGRRGPRMEQVPFVAVCDAGHIQDFPWREWVHHSASPSCQEPLRLRSSGGSTLLNTWVRCDCGDARRSLGRITTGMREADSTFLSEKLDDSDEPFLCKGHEPWNDRDRAEDCSRPLLGGRREASNIYYSHTRSSIYLPRAEGGPEAEILEKFDESPLAGLLERLSKATGGKQSIDFEVFWAAASELLTSYSRDRVEAAFEAWQADEEEETNLEADDEQSFRSQEYHTLVTGQDQRDLVVRAKNVEEYGASLETFFSAINRVPRLRETRAFTGFSRVYPESSATLSERKDQLWRDEPPARDWLPAYAVRGEGIFLALRDDRLAEWESKPQVQNRVAPLSQTYEEVRKSRRLSERTISPRFVLVHTLAHLLINQLTFECGYSSASLRERLYFSGDGNGEMGAVLIYTAAGDADGTMGGLVRMGRPGNLEPVVQKALAEAEWCSADPVCMEAGRSGGQGPDSCNLAACHNCSLLPETSCEEFNRFLDRALVVGTEKNPDLGFFHRRL